MITILPLSCCCSDLHAYVGKVLLHEQLRTELKDVLIEFTQGDRSGALRSPLNLLRLLDKITTSSMTEVLDGAQLRLHSDYLRRLDRLGPASGTLDLLDLF